MSTAEHLAGTDREQISALVHRYADAVVHQDESMWAATWTNTATWALPGGREALGQTAIVELWRASLSKYTSVIQVANNGAVTIDPFDDTTATGRWHISEHFKKKTGEVGILLAHYDDDYQRGADGWRFARRALTVHYQGPPDLSGRFSAETTSA